MADDYCTNPSEYTVDKRCYVTDTQKQGKPYNSVVALITDNDFVYCTGTIVRDYDNKPYLYTAKHCTVNEKNSIASALTIKLQNGTRLSVNKNNIGNYDNKNDENLDGDWAIYSIEKFDIPMVEKTNKIKIGIAPYEIPYDAKVVGYGALKIMSDKDISDFRNAYIEYLKEQKHIDTKGKENIYGFEDGGIVHDNEYVQNFIYSNTTYWELFDDTKLKVSYCKYLSTGREKGCQTWSGNSGGPIFDSDNKIMGIHTRGNGIIGGKRHANNENWWTADSSGSVNLFE